MSDPTSQPRPRDDLRVPLLVWAALLVMVLGVHRMVVACSGPHEGAAIELVHERHGCSHDQAHEHDLAHVHAHEGEDAPCPDGEPCTDHDIELLTFRGDASGDAAIADPGVAVAPPPCATSTPIRVTPRATRALAPEPPWPDRRTSERRTVVLLI